MIILTDLSEVLIRGVAGIEDKIELEYGYETAQLFQKRKSEVEDDFSELMRGCMSEDRFWERFLSDGEWPFGVPEIKVLFSKNLAEEIPGTYDLYCNIIKYPWDSTKKSRLNGRPAIWLASDHVAERKHELKLLHPKIFELVSHCLWSFEEVALKSDPGYFHRIIKRYHLDPSEVLFIDDRVENIYAAAKANIPCLWFQNYHQLRYAMRRHGFWFNKPNQNQ